MVFQCCSGWPSQTRLPAWCRPLLGLLAGVVAGCYLLFIGYINRDAKRRGMSPTLWTIVAVIIPNAWVSLFICPAAPSGAPLARSAASVVQAWIQLLPSLQLQAEPICPQCQRRLV